MSEKPVNPTEANKTDANETPAEVPKSCDVIFMIDATGSMSSAIKAAHDKAKDIAINLKEAHPEIKFRFGSICYRDPVDVRSDKHQVANLDPDVNNLVAFLNTVHASGGGDGPEDIAGAFEIAVNQITWGDGVKNIILMADAPAHGNFFCGYNNHEEETRRFLNAIKAVAKKGIFITGIAIGNDQSVTSCFGKMKMIYDNTAKDIEKIFNIEKFDSSHQSDVVIGDKLKDVSIKQIANSIKGYNRKCAVSYATTGAFLVDQFAKAGSARLRDIETVFLEQELLWDENPLMALRFPFYLRMITRKEKMFKDQPEDFQSAVSTVQRGQGARDEAFKRLVWIAKNHADEFYRNLWIIPIIGSWKDLWKILYIAENSSIRLDETKFFDLFNSGLSDPNHKGLVLKYLPRIRSSRACNSPWSIFSNRIAKKFAAYDKLSYQGYRKQKAQGKAHTFQTIICKKQYADIKWNEIPGKALLNLVGGKFLSEHNLEESYLEWLKTQPVAKFNGYPYELGQKLSGSPSTATRMTIDKQFANLIETASQNHGEIQGNVLCALDTSGSMSARISRNSPVTCYDVCISLGIFFSTLNRGAFENTVALFDSTSSMFKFNGNTFSEKWNEIKELKDSAMGSTNFQSLIDLIVDTRISDPTIPLDDFPKTILVVSDMQFNPSGSMDPTTQDEQTNFEAAMTKLKRVFPEEFTKNFKIIWWFCADSNISDVPSTMNDAGTYVFSGFDGSIISLLLGGKAATKVNQTMEQVVLDALSQPILKLIK